MSNFAFYQNHQLSAMPTEAREELKRVFPNFFKEDRRAVYLRASDSYRHKVSVGANAGRMKEQMRPNAPIHTSMRTTMYDKSGKLNTIVISSDAPSYNTLTQKANYGTSCMVAIGDGIDILDENVLYFLYFHGKDYISNGDKKNEGAPFGFVMAEQETRSKVQNETEIAQFIVKVGKLTPAAVNDLLAKFKIGISEIEDMNLNNLIEKFKNSNKDTRDNLNLFVDASLAEEGGETKETVEKVQELVEKALETAVIKIEDGSVYLRKIGSDEYAKTAVLKLKTEGAETQLLEIVEYFDKNPKKLDQIK